MEDTKKEMSQKLKEEIVDSGWVDSKMQVLMLRFNIYNPNIDMVMQFVTVFENLITGVVQLHHDNYTFNLAIYRDRSIQIMSIFIGFIGIILLVVSIIDLHKRQKDMVRQAQDEIDMKIEHLKADRLNADHDEEIRKLEEERKTKEKVKCCSCKHVTIFEVISKLAYWTVFRPRFDSACLPVFDCQVHFREGGLCARH